MKRYFVIQMAVGAAVLIYGATSGLGATVLGTAQNYAVLGATTVTNTGATTLTGDLGCTRDFDHWLPAGITITGTVHQTDAVAQQAQIDATTAYNVLARDAVHQQLVGTESGWTDARVGASIILTRRPS